MTTKEQTHYDVLGVDPAAGRSEIKVAWMRLVQQNHPDTAPDGKGDSEKFKRVQDAWKALEKEDSRAAYDAELAAASAPPAPRPRPTTTPRQAPAPRPRPAPQPKRPASPPPERMRKMADRVAAFQAGDHTAAAAPVREAVRPVRKTWKDHIPASYTVRFTPSADSRWAPPITLLWALLTTLVGLASAAVLPREQTPVDFLKPMAVPLLVVAFAIFAVGTVFSLLSSSSLRSVYAATAAALLTVPLLFLGGNTLILGSMAVVLFLLTGYATDRASLRNKDIPDYLPSVAKRGIREAHSWGRLNPQFAPPGSYPALLQATSVVEKLAHTLRNIRAMYTVTTPKYPGAPSPLDEIVPRTPIVLTAGRRVMLVTGRVVPQGSQVEVDTQGHLAINGTRMVDLHEYQVILDSWRRHLGQRFTVEMTMLLDSDGPIDIGDTTGIHLSTLPSLEEDLGKYFSPNYTDVDYTLVQAIVPYTETE